MEKHINESRTRNVARNVIFAMGCQVVNLLLTFVSRTVFIKTLGADYLGVNGLYSNILMILSFAELGIGNAIVFSMYKPLANNDIEKLKSLMLFYKKAYQIIGVVVAVSGMCIVPFLNYIIKDKPHISENLTFIYLLFLFNTVVSYFFVYKKSIIIADQKNYIVLLYTEGIHFVQTVLQIVFLYMTKNFIIYLIIQIVCTILTNVFTAFKADKIYPFLKEKAAELSKKESKGIFKNVRALLIYKIGSVVLNGTDNIIISAMIGVREVGISSNYILFTTACSTILAKVLEAFTASVGNLNAVGEREKRYHIFQKLFFITQWIYGFATVGLIALSNNLIDVWIGADYRANFLTVFAIMIGFYVNGVQYAAYTYRVTLGYFVQGKIAPVLAAIINIILSVLFAKWIGIAGVFIATPIARLLSTGIVDPVLVYKNSFNMNPIHYYLKYFLYVVLFVAMYFLCVWCANLVTIGGWTGLILKGIVISVVFNGGMILVFFRNKMFREILNMALGLFKRE